MSFSDELLELFYRHDPVGMARIGAPADEYLPEVADLLPRLDEVTSEQELRQILHEIFVGEIEGAETSFTAAAYDAIAHEIWTKILKRRNPE
jgi:hypothetical protein